MKTICVNDFVKISNLTDEEQLLPGVKPGSYAKVLRITSKPSGKILTLKVNNYWNSRDNVKRFGPWDGLLWSAIVLPIQAVSLH